MAHVHRVYNIQDDAYYVRVEGSSELFKFDKSNKERDSYTKIKALHMIEARKDPKSKFIDHAQPT